MNITIKRNTFGVGDNRTHLWHCHLRDDEDMPYSASSWESAQDAYRLADMRRRIGSHSPAMYMGRTCVHLRKISPSIAKIFIWGKTREVPIAKVDVDYSEECYMPYAYGGYR